jgi:hypothetical protein
LHHSFYSKAFKQDRVEAFNSFIKPQAESDQFGKRLKRTYGTPLKAQRGIFLGVFGFVQIAKIPVEGQIRSPILPIRGVKHNRIFSSLRVLFSRQILTRIRSMKSYATVPLLTSMITGPRNWALAGPSKDAAGQSITLFQERIG